MVCTFLERPEKTLNVNHVTSEIYLKNIKNLNSCLKLDQSVNAFCSELCMKPINTLCGWNAVYDVKAGDAYNNH